MLKPATWGVLLLSGMALTSAYAADAEAQAASHFQTGLAYERLGRLSEAYTQLQLAAVLGPNDARVASALGIVACRVGRVDEAQRALERAITLEPNSIASYYELALIYEKKNLKDRALDAWQRFAQLNNDAPLRITAQKHIQFLQAH